MALACWFSAEICSQGTAINAGVSIQVLEALGAPLDSPALGAPASVLQAAAHMVDKNSNFPDEMRYRASMLWSGNLVA
jgi:hypothetical protein